MVRVLRRAVPLAVILALFVQVDAFATVANVTISNFKFTPNLAKLRIGDSVLWTNDGPSSHTTTSDAPLSLWDSGTLGPGQTFSWPFNAGGAYYYHCAIHANMHGIIAVRGMATPPSGPAGTQFTVRVSKIVAPPQYVYDIQMKAPAGNWQDWMTDVTAAAVIWDSTDAGAGLYQFRSRLRRIADGAASNYSPASKVMVT